MTIGNIDELQKRISKAKSRMILNHPFIGTIALGMPVVITDDPNDPRASVDGSVIQFRKDFIEEQTDNQLLFALAHECFHPMMDHNYRRKGRDPVTWNKATDYVINNILIEENIGDPVDNILHNLDLYNAGDGKADRIYSIIKQEEQQGQSHDDAMDDCLDAAQDPGKSPAQVAQEQADWKIKTAQAMQAAKAAGTLSAGLERFAKEILKPKVDWKRIVHDFIHTRKRDKRTFARMNRRFVTQGLYLPSSYGEQIELLVFAVDCSGSVGQHEQDQYLSEIIKAHEEIKPRKLVIISFDYTITNVQEFAADEPITPQFKGGGGTAFSPVFEHIEKEGYEPHTCIILTDLASDDFGPEPHYPVLWVDTYGQFTPPFGEVVVIEDYE